MIMCHNKIFQLVCWLDANAAHKSWKEWKSEAEYLIKYHIGTYCIYSLLDSELIYISIVESLRI